MKVLIADDDTDMRSLLQKFFAEWGYEPVMACDGNEAWSIMQSPDAPQLVMLDLVMPGIGGLEVCRRLRASGRSQPIYIIVLTALDTPGDTIAGLEAGADDYVVKPFNPEELKQRVLAGNRIIDLQSALTDKVAELQSVVEHVRGLQGTLPICAYCHNVRNEEDAWKRFDEYLIEHMAVELSHGICPDCAMKHFPKFAKNINKKSRHDG